MGTKDPQGTRRGENQTDHRHGSGEDNRKTRRHGGTPDENQAGHRQQDDKPGRNDSDEHDDY